MKLTQKQLGAHLKQSFLPVYLVAGDELALVAQTQQQIAEHAMTLGFVDRIRIQEEGASTHWEQFRDTTENFGLFNAPQLIEMHLPQAKIDEGVLSGYLEKPRTDQSLLIITGKLSSAQQKTKWYTSIEKHGAIVTVWPLNLAEAQTWIAQALQAQGLSMQTPALQVFAQKTEGNLSAALQAIAQLNLLYPKQLISLQQLETVLTDQAQFTVYDLVDSAFAQQTKRALRILDELERADEEPITILWAFVSQIQTVYELSVARAQSSLDQLLMKQWANKRALLKSTVLRWSDKKYPLLFKKALEIEEVTKGAKSGNVWGLLRELLLRVVS